MHILLFHWKQHTCPIEHRNIDIDIDTSTTQKRSRASTVDKIVFYTTIRDINGIKLWCWWLEYDAAHHSIPSYKFGTFQNAILFFILHFRFGVVLPMSQHHNAHSQNAGNWTHRKGAKWYMAPGKLGFYWYQFCVLYLFDCVCVCCLMRDIHLFCQVSNTQ